MNNQTHEESVPLSKMSDEKLFNLSRSLHNQIAYAKRQKTNEEVIKKLQVEACYVAREISFRKESKINTHRK